MTFGEREGAMRERHRATTILQHAIDHVLGTAYVGSHLDVASVDAHSMLKNALCAPPLPRSVCAWCKRVIRDGPEPTSHGICPFCAEAASHE